MNCVRYILPIALSLCAVNTWAQEDLRVNSFAALYDTPSTNAPVLGIFNHGAQVQTVGAIEKEWQRVTADNGMQGYIQTNKLAKNIFGSDEKAPEPYSQAGENGYGSAHMVVIVAGLKARIKPDSPKVACLLSMGTNVSVDFAPNDSGAWVNIHNCGNHSSAYVMRQFLGKRPEIKTLFKDFDALPTNDLATRKTLAERAVELAWNLESDDNGASLKPALNRYMSVAQALNDASLIENTETMLLVVDNMYPKLSWEQIEKIRKTQRFEVVKAGLAEDKFIKLSELTRQIGAPKKINPMQDECGVYMGSHFYEYADATFDVDVKNKKAYVLDITFTRDDDAYYFKGVRLDKNTNERDFVKLAKGWYNTNPNTEPHTYWIDGDAETFKFTFHNGLLSTYHYQAMC